MATSSG